MSKKAPEKSEPQDGGEAGYEPPPPTYEPGGPSQDTTIPAVTPQAEQGKPPQQSDQGPTAERPFDFPAPPSSAPSSAPRHYIVVPQQCSEPASPFLQAYAPSLLARGIPAESWLSFLDTLSAFLAAKVSDRALSHAGDVARQLGKGPTNSFKGVYAHAKNVGQNITKHARRGNVVGATVGAVGGAISIPLSAAFSVIGAVVSMPGSALAAASKKPASQRDRAAAYLAVANKDWFHSRGLDAAIVTTVELEELTGTSVRGILTPSSGDGKEVKTVEEQLAALEASFAKLEMMGSGFPRLEIANETLWVVLNPV
ncbi:hypothetical protein HYQ45_002528 [Verticillium longisporum]|uniref:Uncharacterized protein n=1 Tax=Verticillium longisporum TaxID=100787 RepID=A0A8I2ZY06_VERLO|nr:hypothetical protein HYQ45_002528 [Verticillium longisporum]